MPDDEPADTTPPHNVTTGGGGAGDGGGVPPPQQDVPAQQVGQNPPLGAQPPPQPVAPPVIQQLGPQVSQQDMASAYRLLQSLHLSGQAPNPFPPAAVQQVPLFSVNPVHGVLGVRNAAAAPSASTAVQLPVVDLGQGQE